MNLKRRTVLKVFACLIILLIVVGGTVFSERSASAQEKGSTDPKTSCITAQCHAAMEKQKYIHGPVLAGACAICHGVSPRHKDNPKRNKFASIADASTICYECHEQFEAKKFTHNPFAEGECSDCHDPHGSPHKFLLLAKGGELCFNCHDKQLGAGKYVHGPVAVGGCLVCHEAHTSDYAKVLRAEGSDLCFMCHTDKAEALKTAEYVHKPVSEDCTGCHNPHSAPREFMLLADAPALCLGCHDDQKKQISTASVKHAAVEVDRSCLNCHDAHMSNIAKNLKMEPMDLCLSCHNKAYESIDGKSVMNIQKWLAENKDHHGPIKQKDCSGCHNPHGSANFKILRNPYPSRFYAPFAVENYNLCFGCHEKTLVLDPETAKLTNFRNGNENLHFTHVNRVKGRTCRACHETHASNYPKHIREAVLFGNWELPLVFEKTETGGSCAPGCHKFKKYDRIKKVINE